MRKKRILWDIDGTLAKWNFGISPELGNMHELGIGHYFLNRPPQENLVSAVHYIFIYRREYVQYIITAVILTLKDAWTDKHGWCDRETPEIDREHRIFMPYSEDKIKYVPDFDPDTDILVDDHGPNCRTWAEHGGTYIKVSFDAEDAAYEATRHRYVIHPGMTVEEIVAVIDKASLDMDAAYEAAHTEEQQFDIKYSETYSKVYYGRWGHTYAEAVERLDADIRDGAEEGPELCERSRYENVTYEGGEQE